MFELVSIPIAIVDLTVEYARPKLQLMMDRKEIVDSIFEAFKKWNIKLDDVEVLTEGKPSEQGVKFKLPSRRTSFFFGGAHCRLIRDDANWDSAPETIEILETGLASLRNLGGVAVGSYKTMIALHIQPKNAKAIHLLQRFAAPAISSLEPAALTAFATVVKWEKRRITLDGSSQLANGVYLKFEREFSGTSTYDEISAQLRQDEEELFGVLGVQEEEQ